MKSKLVQTETYASTNNESFASSDDAKESAEASESEVRRLKDYVYDKNYQMYYSLSTGYYYDEKTGLMYEPQSGTYYRYNYEKKEYEKVQGEETNSCIHEDKAETGYMCQSVVDQVNNLNLNDESSKSEKNDNKEISSTVEHENFTNYNANGEYEISLIENENTANSEIININISGDENVSLGCAKDWQPTEGSKLTVTDMVKQVVEEHTNMSDYIYDEQYKMYYSPSTGYFFDAVRNLLYDPTSGIYYFYDQDKQTYEFYCQTNSNEIDNSELVESQPCVDKKRLISRKMYWKKKLEISKQIESGSNGNDNKLDDSDEEFSSPEDGEIFTSDDESDACIVRSPVKGPCPKQKTDEDYPPSIRAIVENSENLQIGSLILITCSGGIIGRDKMNDVYLPDICVSKVHANIKYNSDLQTYSIEDLGSQNGTFINDKRLSEPKLKSELFTLNHGDKLSFGSCKLLLHIHEGHETCDKCEPGQVLAEISSHIEKSPIIMSKEEKEKVRREELRRLKKKYGLQGDAFERKTIATAGQGYSDKAEIRRLTVGSDNPYEKTEQASADISVPETNKGYQMLKKMGWTEGQTLGTTDSGLAEPIPLQFWTSKAGLGASDASSSPSRPVDKRNKKWVKAQERYFQLSAEKDASS